MKVKELTLLDGALPIVEKGAGLPAYVFNPQHTMEEVRTDSDKFMVPYYHVKRGAVEDWIEARKKNPPNPLGTYEGVILTYHDTLLGEPRFGAAIYRVLASENVDTKIA